MSEPGNGRSIVGVLSQMPIGIWVAIVGQLLGFAFWLIKLDNRVQLQGEYIAALQAQIKVMDEKDTHAGNIVSERVGHIEREVAWLVNYITGAPRLPVPGSPP
jgi:hypothetical protein